ncbi:hypothetical protein [Simiduia agarivorans]|uniref:Uncharacterized protein n=1 Tax=Simiduia agarivorans (strain DSM 21679 / JCM 13881 / BCRC 17597 / SA1) TaxID=1117647 RepID=R9S6A3_SIMAS|nr:hypothetical protein [Simiduia agarivorans]AGN11378.1 hypothetical protein M5M_16542 [Simiduia agarivorans SA1 = DSM 21679]
MNWLIPLKLVSYAGLVLILVSSLLVFYQQVDLENFKDMALIGTLVWIFTAPLWINRKA